ncbi:MAG: hypothetical protein KDH15_06050 [Rhodocyclaceae bacterium]|nr:hypothetical protein [Rhodocyclaceae bacterium]
MPVDARSIRRAIGTLALSALGTHFSIPASAQERAVRAPAQTYTTPAERRETGRSRSLTPWLSATALLETEFQRRRIRASPGGITSRSWDATTSLQLGLVAAPSPAIQAELVLQYESEATRPEADEAILTLSQEEWEFEAGRMFTPLGQYFSHFPSGPLLEFGETRAEGVAVAYAPSDMLEFKLMRYAGRARPAGAGRWSLDWAAAVEGRFGGGWRLGASYQSDLADAADGLPEEVGRRHARRVAAAAAFVRWTDERFDVTAELLSALRAFPELAPDRDRPRAWNLEFARFVGARWLGAVRFEGSHELEEAPRRRWGIVASWLPDPRVAISIEYLNGQVPGERPVSEEARPDTRIHQVGIRISLEP